jgi:predicted dehydrogenase
MLKVGIAGYGKIGRIRAGYVNASGLAEVVAIYDINKPEDLDSRIRFCDSYDELIKQNLDAIFICTYNNVNAEYTYKALVAGIHVFCEKPPARSTKELEVVINEKEKSNLRLKYGFNHRLHYSVMEAKKLIESNNMGKMLWMRGVYGKAGSIDYHKNWRNYRKISGGGILIDQGIHMLDLMLYFSGEKFNQIQSIITNAYWQIESEDNAFVNMQSENGVIATLHSSATQWRHKFLLEMCFEEGYINLDGILSSTRSYAPETIKVAKREFEDITFAMGKPQEKIIWFENDDSFKLEVDEFIDAVINDTPIIQGTIQDAYNVLSLVEQIYAKSGFYNE